MNSKKITVAITGATGKVANGFIFRLASGQAFGPEVELELHLIDLEPTLPILQGIKMELEDCAFPLLKEIVCTADINRGMKNVDWAILIGSVPRAPGMQRSDLIKINAEIFKIQGRAINDFADPEVRVLVVGNPCNTNCLVAMHNAPEVPNHHFYALTMLDENRARFQLASQAGVAVSAVKNIIVWGNHSAAQFPDFYHATINDQHTLEVIHDENWLQTEFLTKVRNRGTEILNTKGSSSTSSAASGIIDGIWQLTHPTGFNRSYSMACRSTGDYGIDEGLIYSFPCQTKNGKLTIVTDIKHNEFAQLQLQKNLIELKNERDMVKQLGLIGG